MRTVTVSPYIPYEIPLGEGVRARMVLPHNLSVEDAARLCAVIQSLAFSDEELAAAKAESARRDAERERASRSLGALMADWATVSD